MPRALLLDTVIAESDDTVVVEGNHYFPRTSVGGSAGGLRTTTHCPWKGDAAYQSVVVDGQTETDALWFYPEPYEKAETIRDRVAFGGGIRIED